jgi:hypothetical protein
LRASIGTLGYFQIILEQETLKIPYRIYYDEPSEQGLTDKEAFLMDCMFTRHHSGFVREARLRRIINSDSYVATPFIAQLIGDYVVQILNVIKEHLTPQQLDNLRRLKRENPTFFKITEDRVQSYWNYSYKFAYPDKSEYPGFQLLNAINDRYEPHLRSK